MRNFRLIAGPCSAETELQTLKVAYELKQLGCDLFRAGLWKPRTQPGSFAGVGEEGIAWLCKVQNEVGLPVATEVDTPQHLSLLLEAGFRYFWIGARTTTNPFLVQQLADTLAQFADKQSVVVLVKNPVNPDIELWIGAIERFRKAGISQIVAVHRGFSTLQTSELRNEPLWSIPIELHRRLPDIQLICDPSHICGKAELVEKISQQALNLCFDGLMVETHDNPPKALSDSQQQLTVAQLRDMLDRLTQPIAAKADIGLALLREQIDEVDNQLWTLITQRMEIAKQIGEYKRTNNQPVLQEERYKDLLEKRLAWAEKNNISKDTVLQILSALHDEAIKKQL